ncbi:DMT family transporter [Paenibacillus sp. YN15]|uniref:DMT family transporter n=1 Tax=Paenibacillus sp. YN15 TaxID=1742774 RepID=UPI000DCBA83F|nr:DMT family transporter [Paenibacillus sp. YN15]RAV01303.1 EamA/RhaT family transporter [Paenibacillus sp. YN15]
MIVQKAAYATRQTGWTQQRADSCIALISMAWGASYLLMKTGLDGLGPFNLIGLRFGIAFLVTALLFHRRLRKATLPVIGRGAVLGLTLFGMFSFLMYGLQTTTASTAGFLTSTTVVFVPILQMIITRKKPQGRVVAGVVLTITGIALMTVQDSLALNRGAVFCLTGALLYAYHIILTDRFAQKAEGLLLGILQLGFAGFYGWIASFFFEAPSLPAGTAQWGAVLGLALVCSAFGFVMQPIAQTYTTPEHTGLLFALEPVFSALLAFIFLQEILSVQGYIGAALVLCSVFVAAAKPGGLLRRLRRRLTGTPFPSGAYRKM